MKLNNRERVLFVSLFVAFFVGLAISPAIVYMNASDRLPSGGVFEIAVTRVDGSTEQQTIHNLIVTIGYTQARDYFSLGDTDITKYLALSNDATALVGWTKLPTEYNAYGLTRAAGTVSNVNASAYQTEYEWTCTTDATSVKSIGVHWIVTAESDNNLYAAASFTEVVLNNGDKFKGTYTLNYG